MGCCAREGARVSDWEAWERISKSLSFYDEFKQIFNMHFLQLVDCDWDGNGHGTFTQLFDSLSTNFELPCRAHIRFVPSYYLVVREIDVFRKNDPQHLSGFVRRILYQFIGPN